MNSREVHFRVARSRNYPMLKKPSMISESGIASCALAEHAHQYRRDHQAQARRDPGTEHAHGGGTTPADHDDSDRLRVGVRSGRRRLRREPGAAGGNVTGFADTMSSLGGKWVEL